jgi:hypothetical protein
MIPRILAALVTVALAVTPSLAPAQAPSFAIDEIYSNADGSAQYVVLRETQGQDAQIAFAGVTLTATRAGTTKTYTFPRNPPSAATANARVLVGSVGFQALGLVATDYTIPDRFVAVDGGTLAFGGVDSFTFESLPTDGVRARFRNGALAQNLATNLAGRSAAAIALPITVVEFYNAALDHYFVSPLAPDIDALDTGRFPG